MPRPVQPPRGLPRLRTLGGRADKPDSAHKAFLRVSFLELERSRLAIEMQAVRRRLAGMIARCAEIETEKAGILDGLEPATPQDPAPELPNAPSPGKSGNRTFHMSY